MVLCCLWALPSVSAYVFPVGCSPDTAHILVPVLKRPGLLACKQTMRKTQSKCSDTEELFRFRKIWIWAYSGVVCVYMTCTRGILLIFTFDRVIDCMWTKSVVLYSVFIWYASFWPYTCEYMRKWHSKNIWNTVQYLLDLNNYPIKTTPWLVEHLPHMKSTYTSWLIQCIQCVCSLIQWCRDIRATWLFQDIKHRSVDFVLGLRN